VHSMHRGQLLPHWRFEPQRVYIWLVLPCCLFRLRRMRRRLVLRYAIESSSVLCWQLGSQWSHRLHELRRGHIRRSAGIRERRRWLCVHVPSGHCGLSQRSGDAEQCVRQLPCCCILLRWEPADDVPSGILLPCGLCGAHGMPSWQLLRGCCRDSHELPCRQLLPCRIQHVHCMQQRLVLSSWQCSGHSVRGRLCMQHPRCAVHVCRRQMVREWQHSVHLVRGGLLQHAVGRSLELCVHPVRRRLLLRRRRSELADAVRCWHLLHCWGSSAGNVPRWIVLSRRVQRSCELRRWHIQQRRLQRVQPVHGWQLLPCRRDLTHCLPCGLLLHCWLE